MSGSEPTSPLLALRSITKRFGLLEANRKVSLEVARGSIHAIVGENGAGKSTLMNIIAGMHRPDEGELLLAGRPVAFGSPADAIAAGIGMVHQHFMLAGELTAAENIVLGNEGAPLLGRMPVAAIRKRVEECSRRYGLPVDPDARVSSLGVGQEQRIELLKLLVRDASLMILDEPTAVLTPKETESLFSTLRSLRDAGRSIIIITHKLDEVLAVADRVSVMRQGELVGTIPAATATKEELARMMVGREVLLRVENPPGNPQAPVLEVRNLSYRDPNGVERLKSLDFSIRAGEIYGIAGVEGNGQSELLQLLWGLSPHEGSATGSVLLEGRELLGLSARQIAENGVSHVPEDRLRHAVVGAFSVEENLVFGRHREPAFRKGAGFDREALRGHAERLGTAFDIRCESPASQPLASLSGGNQQKVVVARELDRPGIRLLILAQPTRGVDIGAIEAIHNRLLEARRNGLAMLLISSELEEVTALSTRIGCLYKGSIRHEFDEAATAEGRRDPQRFHRLVGQHIT